MNPIQFYIIFTSIIVFSLTVHEYSHGRAAYYLGDNTAKLLGRLTFNPLKHLDFLGAISFYFLGFGWAKPVPVDPRNFQNPQRDMMYVAMAGPASNFVLALFCGFFLRMINIEEQPIIFFVFALGVYVNSALAIFNMLPIFPLDGASVLKGLVSPTTAQKLNYFDRYMGVLLLGIFLMDYFANTKILISILRIPLSFMIEFFTQETFPLIREIFKGGLL